MELEPQSGLSSYDHEIEAYVHAIHFVWAGGKKDEKSCPE